MLPATAFPVDVVARTAELRAAGTSWENAARTLHCESAEELRYVIDQNEPAYERCLRRARREVLNDSFAEGVFTLRRLMRSPKESVSMRAADAMIRFRATIIRHRKKLSKADAPAAPKPSDDTLRFVQFLESHTDEQLDELIAACERPHKPICEPETAASPEQAGVYPARSASGSEQNEQQPARSASGVHTGTVSAGLLALALLFAAASASASPGVAERPRPYHDRMTLDTTRLPEYLAAATDAARKGAAILEGWRAKFTVREKGRADLVTDADQASQDAVKAALLGAFPEHAFLGEEESVGKSPEQTRPPAGGPPVWVVDPLDGTSNYVHDIPAYCVSIGLWHGGKAVVGVILDPRMNELFTAAAGHGAFLNGKPIKVSGAAKLADAMLSTGFAANYQKAVRNLAAWAKLTEHAQSLRRTGSTALNMAYVAAGRFDGYWAHDNYAWDVMAGACLIAEAGGKLTTVDGAAFDPFRPDILATNGPIHDEVLAILRG